MKSRYEKTETTVQIIPDADTADWVERHCGAEIDAYLGHEVVQNYYREDCYREHWPNAGLTADVPGVQLLLAGSGVRESS